MILHIPSLGFCAMSHGMLLNTAVWISRPVFCLPTAKRSKNRGACHLHPWLLLSYFQLVNLSIIKGDLKIKDCKAFPKLTMGCFTQQDEEHPLQTTGGIFFFPFTSVYFPLNLQELIKQPVFLKPTRDTGLAEVSHCKKCQT